MRWLITLLFVGVAVIALSADVSHAEKKWRPNKNHPWYPNCVINYNVCTDTSCNFPGDPELSGKNACQADCMIELDKCLGQPPRTRRETGITGGNSSGGVDPGASPKPKARPEGTPATGGVSPN